MPAVASFRQRNQCFLYRARRNADAAHVVITNHALLLTDVVQGGESLPEARHLIIDEAHHLEDQATTSFQTAISQRIVATALNGLASDGRRGGPPGLLVEIDSFFGSTAMNVTPQDQRNAVRQSIGAATRAVDRVRTGTATLFAGLAQLVGEFSEPSREYAARTRLTDAIRRSAQWEGIELGWDGLNVSMTDLTSELAQLQAALPEAPALDVPAGDVSDDVSLRLEELENRLGSERHIIGELAALLHEAIHNPRNHNVYWLESRQLDSQSTTLFAAPLHLAEYLRTNLYSRLDTLVLTSATMTTGGSTAYVRKRLGLPDADEFHVASPFDYEKNALLILPSDVPEPNVATFDAAAHQAIYETAVAAEGRTLVLFTSIAAMNTARLRLAKRSPRRD